MVTVNVKYGGWVQSYTLLVNETLSGKLLPPLVRSAVYTEVYTFGDNQGGLWSTVLTPLTWSK